MVDFQSRDTRRGPPLDDDKDEPDEDGDPSDEPTADEEDSDPADNDSAGERTDGDGVSASGGPEVAETSAETGTPTEAPSNPPASGEERPSGPTPVDEEPSSTVADDTPATDPLEDQGEAPSPAGGTTATREASEPAATGDEPTESTATPETAIRVAVVTVGPGEMERVEETVAAAFEAAGHAITVRERLRGEYDTLQQVVDRLVSRADVDTVVTAGGIGIAADERTIEAVHPLFAKALPGFGEAFRAHLFEEIGTGIVAVRSTAGVADGTLVFCLPGDAEAARFAVEEILVPEAPQLVAHLR